MKFTAPLSVFFLLILGISGPAWSNSCRSLLENSQIEASTEVNSRSSWRESAPLSIRYYLDRVGELYPSQHLYPKFIDPATEKELVPLWTGTTEVPLAIQQTLIDAVSDTGSYSTSVIDYQLLSADKGVVKTATPGNFLSLRWNEEWKGRNMSTNMGVFAPSFLKASAAPDYSYVVSSDAKAVFLFLHGGGTATTGHHVAASITNYLGNRGVAVVSIDSLYHAYGPREDLSPEEYYEYLKDLRYKIAPPNVPVFVGGHSMGGEHADNLMRLSEQHGIGEAFSGFISLSTPLDEAPGESLERKEEVKDEILSRDDVIELIPESERDLNVTLFLQGKIAQLSGISTTHFSALLDWSKPEHMGASWNPALYLMGRYDALYVGREVLFNDYVTALDNTEVHIMDDRIDHNGNEVNIGHMIFDHQMPDDPKAPESFTRIKDFIGRSVGANLSAETSIGQHGLMTNVLVEYYTNLAFRVFLKEHFYLISKGKEAVSNLGRASKELSGEIKRLKTAISQANGSEEESVESLEAELREKETELHRVQSYLRKTYVPLEGEENHEFATLNIAQRQELAAQIKEIYSQRAPVEKAMKKQKDPLAKAKKSLDALVTQGLYAEESELPEALKPVRESLESYVEEIVEFYKEINDENGEYALAQANAGTFEVDPPAELKEKYTRLSEMHQRYVEMEEEAKAFVRRLISQGVYGSEAQGLVISLYGSEEALVSGELLPESLLAQEADLRERFETLSVEASKLEFIRENLENDYIQVILSDYYTSRITSGALELERDLLDLMQNDSVLQDMWKKWHGQHGIWKARPADAQTSLY